MKNSILTMVLLILFSVTMKAEAPDTSKIPDKWKKESLIILLYKYEQEVKTYGTGTQRIKIVYYLRDKWGLDEVSQINLPYALSGNLGDGSIGKIYKKNGKEIEIDTAHLIPQKTTININNSSTNRSILSLESQNGRKLAVPYIEVGDILEINYTVNTNVPPNHIPLVNEFCMLKYEVSMTINNSSSYPGYGLQEYAFKNKIMNSTVDFKTHSSEAFLIEMENVNKYKEEILNDNLSQIPYILINFTTNFSPRNDDYTKLSGDELKQNQTDKVLDIFYKGDAAEKTLAKSISGKLLTKHPKITDTSQFINDAYYFYRESVAGEYAYLGFNKTGYKNDYFFVNVMGRVFTERAVKYKAFLSQESHYGGVKKVNDMIQPVYGITIPDKNKHLFNPLYNLEPNNIPSYFENQKYITFDANQYYRKAQFKWYPFALTSTFAAFYANLAYDRIQSTSHSQSALERRTNGLYRNVVLIGASGLIFSIVKYGIQNSGHKKHAKFGYEEKTFQYVPADNNRNKNELTIENIIPSANKISLSSKHEFYGKMRIDELRTLANYSNAYYEKENQFTKAFYSSTNKNKQSEEDKENEVKTMKKVFKSELEDDNFEVEEIKDYKIEKADYFNTDQPVEYTINFTAKNIVTKSENYLVVQVGKLIGGQLSVNEANTERTQDFYIPFQKLFEKAIKIKIPSGYTIQNLEEFNVSKQTSAGQFFTKATIENGYFVLHTTKVYGFQYYDKEDVDDIYSFLRLAQEFENKNLVLKNN